MVAEKTGCQLTIDVESVSHPVVDEMLQRWDDRPGTVGSCILDIEQYPLSNWQIPNNNDMNSPTQISFATKAALLLGASLFAGCSGQQEDVRLTFCKDLITARLDSPRAVEWKGSDNEIRRPEYAKISVTFEAQYQDAGIAPMQAACFYQYTASEDDAMTHSDPLSAYATVPYKMTMNGEPVAKRDLHAAVKTAALNQGKELVDRVQEGVADAAQHIRKELAK